MEATSLNDSRILFSRAVSSRTLRRVAMDAPLTSFATLLSVLLVEVVRWLPSPFDVARLDCTSRLFHLGAPRSVVEEGLRLRAEAAGRTVEAALPAGEKSWAQWLMWEERRLLACAPPVASSCLNHSAFVDAGRQLLTCGSNVYGLGMLGQGESVLHSVVPRAVAGLGGVRIRTVAVGGSHTLACSDEGVVYSCGYGRFGQLGHGDTSTLSAPRVLKALQDVRISEVAACGCHSLALSRAGALYSFGLNAHGQLGLGMNMHGRIDLGDCTTQLVPRRVAALHDVRISAVATGQRHSLVLSEGNVYSFGCGKHGRLGHGERTGHSTPRTIVALQGVRVGAVAAGGEHSLVVSTAGRIYSFGRGNMGQCGHDDTVDQLAPRLVGALLGMRVSAVAAGFVHSLVLSEGNVYSFGCGEYGKLGHGNIVPQPTPLVVTGLQGVCVCSVAAGHSTSLAVTTDGEAYGWGGGGGGGMAMEIPQPVLGLELTENQRVPRKYPGLCLLA